MSESHLEHAKGEVKSARQSLEGAADDLHQLELQRPSAPFAPPDESDHPDNAVAPGIDISGGGGAPGGGDTGD